jgi:2-aminoadipate transaminase
MTSTPLTLERYLSTAARQYQESAIRSTGALAAKVPDLISFAAGAPAAETFPYDELRAITQELLERRDGFALQYGATRGYRPLVDRLVIELGARGINARSDEIIVTTGSQQGLDLCGRVLIDPHDVVLVELPTYSGAIAAFHNLQAALVGVPADAEGVSLEALDEVVAHVAASGRRARFLYVTPNFQNPAGTLMSQPRRRALIEAAARHDLLILEDDPYGTLYFEDAATADETRPLKAIDTEGRVVYLGSISKTLVPGLRVAWVVAPPTITERIELAKQASDLCTGVFDQRIVHAALDRGVVAAMAPKLRAHYQEKRCAMEDALREHVGSRVEWISPRGGFFLWARLPDGIDDRALFEQAVAHRVSFVIGSAFFVNGEGHNYARLAFSATPLARIKEGVTRLREAMHAVAG